MTLGCGGFGGNITSDNISPKHLLNIKRVAYELRPAVDTQERGASRPASEGAALPSSPAPALPRAPRPPETETMSAAVLTSRIDQFLASRGVTKPSGSAPERATPAAPSRAGSGTTEGPAVATPTGGGSAAPAAFVCEDDVRTAAREGRTILVGERTIITPAARDAGEASRIFVWEGWRP
jgi:acetaldehyde dehydrogenase (acetylating)